MNISTHDTNYVYLMNVSIQDKFKVAMRHLFSATSEVLLSDRRTNVLNKYNL